MPRTQNIAAAGLALAASAILSLIDNFVGAVSQEAGLWQFQLFRTLFAVPILLVMARASGVALRPVNLARLAGRSLAVSVGLLVYFAALGSLPVAQAGAGLFSAPLWVALLSVVLFRQKIGRTGALAVIIGFAGALMLLQPDLSGLTAQSLLPLSAGLFYGLGMLLTRYWCADESLLALALGIFLCVGTAAIIMLAVVGFWPGSTFTTRPWVLPSTRFLGLTLFQAVGAVIAISFIAQGYKIGNPSVVAVFEYSFLIFAIFWGYLLWGNATNLLALIGMVVILTSGLMMARSALRHPEPA